MLLDGVTIPPCNIGSVRERTKNEREIRTEEIQNQFFLDY